MGLFCGYMGLFCGYVGLFWQIFWAHKSSVELLFIPEMRGRIYTSAVVNKFTLSQVLYILNRARIYTCECVLQCVAVCCSVLQCVAVCCSVLQCVAVCCSVLQCVAVSQQISYLHLNRVRRQSHMTPRVQKVLYIHSNKSTTPKRQILPKQYHIHTKESYITSNKSYIHSAEPLCALQRSSKAIPHDSQSPKSTMYTQISP